MLKGRDKRLVIATKKKAKLEVVPIIENPKKRLISSQHTTGGLQTFYYADSPNYFCFSWHRQFISMPEDLLFELTEGIRQFKEMKPWRIEEAAKERIELLKKNKEEKNRGVHFSE